MDTDDAYAVWARDAGDLAQIGRALFRQPTRVRVRVPQALADRALAAWNRDDEDGRRPVDPESTGQRTVRARAATFSLIGCSIEERGIEDGGDVLVELDAWYIGDALQAADDAGCSRPPPTP